MVNRKGFMFTLTSLLFIFLFSLIIFSYYDLTQDGSTDLIRHQTSVYQTYYESLKQSYIPILVKISSREVLSSITNFSIDNQAYVPADQFSTIFSDLMANGSTTVSYTGSSQTISLTKGENYTLTKQLSSYISGYDSSVLFESATINITPLWPNLQINQSVPWEVDVHIPFSISLSHSDFMFSDTYIMYSVSVPIIGISDPLFGIESSYPFSRPIKNSSFVLNIWSSDLLESFVLNDTYIKDPSGTSFLMRLTNSTTQITPISANMISFVNPNYLNDSADPLYDDFFPATRKSFRDDYFFTDMFSTCYNGIDQIDFLYNITELIDATGLNFRLDFNSTVQYLGEDFSDSDEYAVSCSRDVGP